MLWASQSFLALCEKLSSFGIRPRFEAGEVLGRGFADLGIEEFLILPSLKMLSLMTGKITALAQADRDRLFLVPDIERLAAESEAAGLIIDSITFPDAARWECHFYDADFKTIERASGLKEALAIGLVSHLERRLGR